MDMKISFPIFTFKGVGGRSSYTVFKSVNLEEKVLTLGLCLPSFTLLTKLRYVDSRPRYSPCLSTNLEQKCERPRQGIRLSMFGARGRRGSWDTHGDIGN